MDYPAESGKDKGVYLKYTEQARAFIELKKEEYEGQIEKRIKEKKLIPGENVIEVTPTDIKNASSDAKIPQIRKYSSSSSIIGTIFYSISSVSIFSLMCALFYDSLRMLGLNGFELFMQVIGICLIFSSYTGISAYYFSYKEKLRAREIERRNILDTLENIDLQDEYKFKLLNKVIDNEYPGK